MSSNITESYRKIVNIVDIMAADNYSYKSEGKGRKNYIFTVKAGILVNLRFYHGNIFIK